MEVLFGWWVGLSKAVVVVVIVEKWLEVAGSGLRLWPFYVEWSGCIEVGQGEVADKGEDSAALFRLELGVMYLRCSLE